MRKFLIATIAIVFLTAISIFAAFIYDRKFDNYRIDLIRIASHVFDAIVRPFTRHYLNYIPKEWQNSRIIFARVESREDKFHIDTQRLIVFELPPAIADEISEGGLEYFSKLGSSAEAMSENRHFTWSETPSPLNERFNDPPDADLWPTVSRFNIFHYLNEIDHKNKLEQKYISKIKGILASKGAYLGQSDTDAIVIDPRERSAIYMCAKKDSTLTKGVIPTMESEKSKN